MASFKLWLNTWTGTTALVRIADEATVRLFRDELQARNWCRENGVDLLV